jgi:hypothetical protein
VRPRARDRRTRRLVWTRTLFAKRSSPDHRATLRRTARAWHRSCTHWAHDGGRTSQAIHWCSAAAHSAATSAITDARAGVRPRHTSVRSRGRRRRRVRRVLVVRDIQQGKFRSGRLRDIAHWCADARQMRSYHRVDQLGVSDRSHVSGAGDHREGTVQQHAVQRFGDQAAGR